jgi:hypothetical protein
MSDLQLRQGIRILLSGGACTLELEELSRIHKTCKEEIDLRVFDALDLSQFYRDINKRCWGGVARLKRAYRKNYGKELTGKDDLATTCPRKLLSTDDYGRLSLLAFKYALDAQLRPKKLPLPIAWQTAPSFDLESLWGRG